MKKFYMNKIFIDTIKFAPFILFSLLFFIGPAYAQNISYTGSKSNLSSLRAEIKRLSETSGGTMGVAVVHLETGVGISIRGNERFPMASTYKVPVAVTLLQQVDKGTKKLSDRVEVTEEDLVTSEGIAEHFQYSGIVLSLHNLLEPMLIVSDNTATDVLMENVGGPEHITKRMKDMGIKDIQVSRNTAALIRDFVGMPQPPVGQKRSLLKELKAFTPEEIDKMAKKVNTEFSKDPQDTATPDAMAALLKKIWDGSILSNKSTALIKDIMLRCATGKNRLKGILPIGTPVAHKTGTIGGTTNNVGVMTLPNGKGHLIVAAFIKDSSLTYDQRDRAIAEVARAAHDYFVFNIEKISN
jgi:beta-lactamase class A